MRYADYMKRAIQALAVLAIATLLMSCRPYVMTCQVPVLTLQQHLVPEAWSKTYGECVETIGPRIPVRYTYHAGDVHIRIAAGDRDYPRLYLDAQTSDGQALRIVSVQAVEAQEAGRPVPVILDGRAYRYFVANSILERRDPIEIDVLDAAGARVARVTFAYRLVYGYDLEYDTI